LNGGWGNLFLQSYNLHHAKGEGEIQKLQKEIGGDTANKNHPSPKKRDGSESYHSAGLVPVRLREILRKLGQSAIPWTGYKPARLGKELAGEGKRGKRAGIIRGCGVVVRVRGLGENPPHVPWE